MTQPGDETSEKQYVLRTSCLGHQEDVRGLAADSSCFVSASRDRTVKVWAEIGPNEFTNTLTLVGHQDYVGAVATDTSGSGTKYATGSRDKTVRLWNSSGDCLKTLEGHKWQITSILLRSDGGIISASLDGTIREWNESGEAAVLEGHDGPVQCLAFLPDGALLSGSNDKTIRRWLRGSCQQTITGHEDTVRGLAVVPGLGFVSASHDTTLRIWTASGETVATLLGHTALVYSAAAAANGMIASASEDNTARLWRPDGTCLQVIEHTACVWDVLFLPSTDLVTACADSAAHVWTTDLSRAAAADDQREFQAAVEARKAAASGGAAGGGLPQGLNVEDPMVLAQSGSRDGQTVVVREGSAAVAYSWSQQRNEWEKVGEVVSGPQDTMAVPSKQHGNQSWDYVFDVDIADGAPVKKLAANRGEDPYDAADRFLQQEQLPLSYREQIAQFVVDNSHGGITYAIPAFNADPFTGGGAYVPTGPIAAGSAASGPGRQQHQVTGGGADPFTGSAPTQHVTGNGSSEQPKAQPSFMAFTAVPKVAVLAEKIRSFGKELSDSGSTACLTEAEAAQGGTLDALLSRRGPAAPPVCRALSGRATAPAALAKAQGQGILNGGSRAVTGSEGPPSQPEEQLLTKLLGWPSAQLFPVLDVTRLLALDAEFAKRLAAVAGPVATSHTASGGVGGALSVAMAEPQSTPNQQTGLRLICNAFLQPPLRSWVSDQISACLDGFAGALMSPSKAVRLGAATMLLNCAVLGGSGDEGEQVAMQVLSGLLQILSSTSETDLEVTFRSVTAVGILLDENSNLCSVAKDLELAAALRKKESMGGRVASVVKTVLRKVE